MSGKLIILMLVVALSFGLVFVSGCESDAQTGALLGSGIGAGVGALGQGGTELVAGDVDGL